MGETKENSATDALGLLVKQIKTMWIVIILLIVLFVGSNMTWLYVFRSYDHVSQDGDGQNYFSSKIEGSIYNGPENQEQEKWEE